MIVPDRRDAIFQALKRAAPNDVVLIAGKGHENYQIIGNDKFDFDDRKVALEALAEIRERLNFGAVFCDEFANDPFLSFGKIDEFKCEIRSRKPDSAPRPKAAP